jgi:spermidine synthase
MAGPYLILPIGLLLSILYFISWLLLHFKVISKSTHRKCLNVALAVTFLVTAIPGILLAIQINFKFEWTFVKWLLTWHVNFGIAMGFIGIIHLLWHNNYYLTLFKKEKAHSSKEIKEEEPIKNVLHLKVLMLLSGFIATSVQVLLIREITTVFQGNELMMSWTLAVWMLLVGLGALLGRRKTAFIVSRKTLGQALIFTVILPIPLVVLLYLTKNMLFLPGVLVNPMYFMLCIIAMFAPICLTCGIVYSLLMKSLSAEPQKFTRVYTFEALGSLTAGIFVSLVLIRWMSVLDSLFVIVLLTATVLSWIQNKKGYYVFTATILLVLLCSTIFRFDLYLKLHLFINQKVLVSKETYHGNIAITSNGEQYSLFENGSLLYSTDNVITCEEYTHYPLMQRNQPKRVLLISGGIAGMVSEILKYPSVERIDYVEMNPCIIELASSFKPLPTDSRLNVIVNDGRNFLKKAHNKYDIAIMAVPDPVSLQINRYYTLEFVELLKNKLQKSGVLLYALSPSGNYLSKENQRIGSSIYQTLKRCFINVEIIPGEKDYLLASDSLLCVNIAELSAGKPQNTTYVNQYYIDDLSIHQRGRQIKKSLDKGTVINTDDKPVPVYFHTLRFMAEFKTSIAWIIPAILLIIPVFFIPRIASGIYWAGFTASAFEVIILFAFQTFYGYVYSALGMIVAVFMGGLALGASLANRFTLKKVHFIIVQSLLAVYSLLFLLFWKLLHLNSNWFGVILFLTFTLLLSTLVGFQYAVGTLLLPGSSIRNASFLYTIDLIGAALGIFLISLVLIPVLGIQLSCLILATINILAIIINLKST